MVTKDEIIKELKNDKESSRLAINELLNDVKKLDKELFTAKGVIDFQKQKIKQLEQKIVNLEKNVYNLKAYIELNYPEIKR